MFVDFVRAFYDAEVAILQDVQVLGFHYFELEAARPRPMPIGYFHMDVVHA